jgi:hypothetical protein
MRAEFFGGSEMRRLVGRSERGGCCFTTRLAVTADTFPWQLAKYSTFALSSFDAAITRCYCCYHAI